MKYRITKSKEVSRYDEIIVDSSIRDDWAAV